MKFKSKEDLVPYGGFISPISSKSFIDGVNYSFNSFKERIDFYNKHECTSPFKGGYSEHLERIIKENPELYHKFLKDITNEKGIFWNTWLFQYCFGDIE